jgi:hypothetical protein
MFQVGATGINQTYNKGETHNECENRFLERMTAEAPEMEAIRSSLQPPAHLGSSLADFSTLKMEAVGQSELNRHSTRFGKVR